MNETKTTRPLVTLSAPIDFWRALLNVRNVAFAIREELYFSQRGLPSPDSFRHSLDVVDNYLDQLFQEDSFNDDGDAK